ncbi:hypothetical protein SynWH8101_2272 [Synechococcus sp. WH 8101]|nr:hypothetical protein SynWH8101_2272 [Synechococcus sp. WH 8101]
MIAYVKQINYAESMLSKIPLLPKGLALGVYLTLSPQKALIAISAETQLPSTNKLAASKSLQTFPEST